MFTLKGIKVLRHRKTITILFAIIGQDRMLPM